jgi:2-keto-4-pentenoate hydratase/2-oxohepta-3-ene-1,7-dioic acid hydratase in catechol pathway
MKIFCVGRNYADHARELNNPLPTQPVIFMKPATALLPKETTFYLPDFSQNIHYECEIVLKINKMGKHIKPKFASKYFSEFTLGLDFTARDLQQKLKEKGLPWEIAKAFDHSAYVGKWLKADAYDLKNLSFSLLKNNQEVQVGHSTNLIFSFSRLISYLSTFFTLQTGDIIFTGTPAGVGPVAIGDFLDLKIGKETIGTLSVK